MHFEKSELNHPPLKNTTTPVPLRSWEPFLVIDSKKHAQAPRSIQSIEGIGDRLRAAAFAEIQAREAFLWASENFTDIPPTLKHDWQTLAKEEDKHMNWLLNRLADLKQNVKARAVSTRLWESFIACETAERFAQFMASAEERGRQAGERFYENLKEIDPISAAIFKQIALEEISHIELARKYFPTETPSDSI